MSDSEKITIKVSDYEYLKKRDEFLQCLENWGVDNWSGYDEAQEEFRSED